MEKKHEEEWKLKLIPAKSITYSTTDPDEGEYDKLLGIVGEIHPEPSS